MKLLKMDVFSLLFFSFLIDVLFSSSPLYHRMEKNIWQIHWIADSEITNVIDTRKNYVAANEANSEAESMSLSGSRTINTPLTNLALFITALSIMAFAT